MSHDGVMQQRHSSLRSPPIGFAHRGAKAHAPENTLEAFALALKLGATGLESDVWITADGHAVLDHDGVVRHGMFDLLKRPVSEIRRSELPDHVPTLAELFDACGTDYELSLDVKDAEAVDETIRVAREAGIEQRMWLCYPKWQVVASWRDLTSAVLVDSTRYSRMREGPERRAAALANAGIDAINMHHSDWSGGLCTLFHRFDRYCLGWDAQLERVIGELVAMGLDGVFSDHVDRLVNVIDAPREPRG
ncbi:MAG: glycerophosphodiester phosphodiesterase [Actinobacteria bacterium]|nr:glycerophosphodiester phosphodiesterase [Actinomycetota bacterium]